MTNPDSGLKSRDITLPTKVHIVKAMVFLVVMYGCESWTVKKADTKELLPSNCGANWATVMCSFSWKNITHIQALTKFTQKVLNNSDQVISLLNLEVTKMRKAVL